MDVKKYTAWLQISANLGILIGLVLVGFQMQQNADLLRTQLSYDESDRYIQGERLLSGENPAVVWAKSIESPAELTLAEQRIAESIIWVNVEQWRAAYKLGQIGLLGGEWRARVENEASWLLGNEFGRAWWKIQSEDDPGNEFNKTVSTALAAGPNQTKEYFAELMANVEQAAAHRDSTK